jgi:nucleoside-diphosphate-sugar epimerase
MTKPRSALVTGGTGLIGSALLQRLLAEGVAVDCLIRKGSLSKLPPMAGLRAIEVSSFEKDVLRNSLAGTSSDVVFHLASYGVQANDRDRDQLIAGNVQLLAHVLEAVLDHPPTKFIFAGSCSEYGFPAKDGQRISEDQGLRPTSLYGAAKAAAEIYGQALASQLKIPFVTLRLFNVFGPGEGAHRLLPSIIHALDRDEPVALTGGEQQRDLLHVDDVAGALFAAACSGHLKSAAYNVCSGVPVRIREVGETAARIMNKPQALLQWGKLAYRSDEPMWVVGDPARFQEATSWQPKLRLAEGIRDMVAALRSREHQNAI